jgi:hypothetical protein
MIKEPAFQIMAKSLRVDVFLPPTHTQNQKSMQSAALLGLSPKKAHGFWDVLATKRKEIYTFPHQLHRIHLSDSLSPGRSSDKQPP